MTICLPDALESRVRQQVKSGGYDSASDLIRDALVLFENHKKTQRLKAGLDQALKDVASNRFGDVNIEELNQQARQIFDTTRQSPNGWSAKYRIGALRHVGSLAIHCTG